MPTASSSPPVARLRTPGELLAAVPLLCGFVPAASLVLLCLHGPRRHLVLTARVDLPPPGCERALAEQLADTVLRAGADEVVLSAWSDVEEERPHADVVREVARACERAGVVLSDALLVRGGRWWSYLCDEEACCPSAGTALPASSPSVDVLAAHRALEGRAVLPSREALAASLDPLDADEAVLHRALEDRARRLAVAGRERVGGEALTRWRRALQEPPDDARAAALVVALVDRLVRDTVMTWALDDEEALLGLVLHLARRTPAPHDAPLCAVLAWLAHARGDGALANVALDRALASDPECSLAQLGRAGLDQQVPPAEVRGLLARTREVLRAQHPWTVAP